MSSFELPIVLGGEEYVEQLYFPGGHIERTYTSGDLPYLDNLLVLHQGDIDSVKSEIYREYNKIGKGKEAFITEEKLKRGFEYAKKVIPEINQYIKNYIKLAGKSKDTAELRTPEFLPLYLPHEEIKGNIKGKGIYGFSGAAAGTTKIPSVLRYKTDGDYLILGNLPLAYIPQEDVDDIILHEAIHILLSEIGIPDKKQQELEPHIDKCIIDFYRDKGEHKRAEKHEKRSAYLSKSKQLYII